jgi:pyruvate-ferredoxin/flavodoxin oxidoreductase
MAERSGSGVAWLQRLWRRTTEDAAAHPGTAALVPVEQALAMLESQLCEGIVRRGGEPLCAALANRTDLPGPQARNVFGRPVHEETAVAAVEGVTVATGMALAGLRASAFLTGDELLASRVALRSCAERLAPLVVHASCGDAGHDGYHGVAESGAFQVLASSAQEALDLSLVARWVSERTLVPGLVCTDLDAVESLKLPDAEAIRGFLGQPDEPIASISEAQRLLVGLERPRQMAWFDPDRPVATGGMRGPEEMARAQLGRRVFFWNAVAAVAEQGMQELSRLTGRRLSFLQQHQLDDAETVLVAQGALVQSARAVAEHVRQARGWKVGVLGITWLRPFPAQQVARALEGRRAVAVLEACDESSAATPPLFRELAEAGGASDTWISATCSGTGANPAALIGLCELLRQPGRPQRIRLEHANISEASGLPRREALVQSVANAYPDLLQGIALDAEPSLADPKGGRSLALVGREAELPPDALRLLAELLAAEVGPAVRGNAIRIEPDAWEARLRAAPADFPDPGPRAPVSLLLAATDDLRNLGHPLASVAPGSDVLVATRAPAEALWNSLPQAWRTAIRDGEHRLLLVEEGFEAALEALRACLRGEQANLLEEGRLREVAWQGRPPHEVSERDLPRLVSRVSQARPAHDSLPRFWGEVVQPRQSGARDDFPDPLTTSGIVPAGASALEAEANPRTLPALDPALCTGCGRCWSACPDSAIGVTAIEAESLLTTASQLAGTEGEAADALRRAHKHLAGRLVGQLAKQEPPRFDAEVCRDAWSWTAERLNLGEEQRPAYDTAFDATLQVIDPLHPVVTEALFRQPEREQKGAGRLLVLTVDPRACLGCKACVTACPEAALQAVDRTPERVAEYNQRWRTWEALPDTDGETLARAASHPDVGPLASVLLSRHCAQAQVGGAGGEPGSGERLASRLVAALVEQHGQRQMAALLKSIETKRAGLEQKVRERLAEGLSEADLATLQQALTGVGRGRADISELGQRLEALGSRATFDRRAVLRMTRVAAVLDDYRQRIATGHDGLGRARFGVVVARGRVAEWAARFPRHPYYAPLTVASTGQAVELARGIGRGLLAEHLTLARSLRRAALEANPPPDRLARVEEIESIGWSDLDAEERASCPPLLLLADDTSLLEQGFDTLARLFDSELPVKVILLDGCGRLASGPEPVLVAMAHRRAFVVASSLAHPAHLSQGVADALASAGPALIHLHVPSPERHGFPADAALEQARLAVEGRAQVLFRYDPQAEGLFGVRASLDGNPGFDQDWGGASFAEWAASEGRFAQHFEPLEAENGLPLTDWLTLSESERSKRLPSIEVGDRRLTVSQPMARATAERLALWNTLRELTGGASPFTERIRASLVAELQAEHEAEISALKAESEARIAETAAGADRQALDRLTNRLLALSGFGPPQTGKGNDA